MREFRSSIERLTRYERVSAILLALFGLAAIFLGFAQMKSRIFYGGEKVNNINTADITSIDSIEDAEAVLKAEDTDKDGISDYDEITLYKTSPYLTDSDSDGVSDAQEIANGENPNCPKGETCFGFLPASEANAYAVGNEDTDSIDQVDVIGLRAALRSAGLSDDVLDNIDDQTLLELYEETIQESPETALGAIQQLGDEETISDVRGILIQSGMDPEQVNALSDEEVMELMQSALQQAQ